METIRLRSMVARLAVFGTLSNSIRRAVTPPITRLPPRHPALPPAQHRKVKAKAPDAAQAKFPELFSHFENL